MEKIFGGIEAGGTKFVCAVGNEAGQILAQTRFPTKTPAETINESIAFFMRQQKQLGQLTAIGIGAFGPLDPNPNSATYGYITSTPKPGWTNAEFVSPIRSALSIPIGFDTDVNAATIGEWRWGSAQRLDTFVYLTIGTGIGGGAMVGGKLVHGMLHPEMGHFYVDHDRLRDPFKGVCPYHDDCLEGLASGPALRARWGQPAETMRPDHPAWDLEAHYLALALVSIICTLSPQRIILGGGVMNQSQLFPMVRSEVQNLLNGYIQTPQIMDGIDGYIVPPGLGPSAGVLGSVALAIQAAQG